MYEDIYERIRIYKDSSIDFLIWIGPRLTPALFQANDIIYFEGDRVKQIYSLSKGQVTFVLPEFNSCEYILVEEGDSFGYVDICRKENEAVQQGWYKFRHKLVRKFTTRCKDDIETLVLPLKVLEEMTNLFTEEYKMSIRDLPQLYCKMLALKKRAQENCNFQQKKLIDDVQSKSSYKQQIQEIEKGVSKSSQE